MQFTFALGHHDGSGGITDDIRNDSGHVQNPVNAGQQADRLQRQVDRVQHDRQHDQTGARDAGCTD